MNHPIFQNKWYIVLFGVICLLAGLLQAGLLSPLVAVPFWWLLLDGILCAVLLGGISIPLWMVIRFVDFSNGNKTQQWLNSFALCVLTIACWLGLNLLGIYICLPTDYFSFLLPTIP